MQVTQPISNMFLFYVFMFLMKYKNMFSTFLSQNLCFLQLWTYQCRCRQLFCIRQRPGSVHWKGDLPAVWAVGLGKLSASVMPRSAVPAFAELSWIQKGSLRSDEPPLTFHQCINRRL